MDSSDRMQSIVAHLDEVKFGQVITNLIGNALKFTQSGGSITISVTHVEARGTVRISVMDTGVGIAPVCENAICFQLLLTNIIYMIGKYRQTFSRCRTVLARYSSAGRGSWLGTLQ